MSAALCAQNSPPVEIELMTYSEIYSAIHEQGKTTVIIYSGGTEQHGRMRSWADTRSWLALWRRNESIVDSMAVNGFKNIVLIGDHGGAQKELEALATRMDAQ